MNTPKKVIKKEDDSSSSNDKPTAITETPKAAPHSALRLILRFEGSSENSDATPQPASNPTNNSIDTPTQTPKKKSKKKKKDKDRTTSQPESMYIVLDSSDTKDGSNVQVSNAIIKQETQAERERRLSVSIRQRHNRSPLQRLLDYAIQQLEDKDAMQVFAWPVTDQIAPGYSKVVKNPMDFSTMRQKINDNLYTNFGEFSSDFQLMCNNAMMYNRPDTMYYKAAKRLLHSGLKFLSVEKFRQLANSFPLIKQIPPEQLGFDWETGSAVEFTVNKEIEENESTKEKEDKNKKRGPNELTTEEALELAKKSACSYDERQSLKRRKITYNMGFLRQRQDGSTSLAIFVPGEGVDPERPGERVVTVGQMVGKLTQGTGQLQGFREHRRNIAKVIKPLTYGPFSSYAPSYDSTFANLSKEESDLVYNFYGEENPPYIENVLSMAKVCDYTLTMVDNLLDVVSGGEYRKSQNVIDDQKKLKEEGERFRDIIEKANNSSDESNVRIEYDQLKSLADLGIDTAFLEQLDTNDSTESDSSNDPFQKTLNMTSKLIEKLHKVQYERLSAPPPPHLSQIPQPSELEVQLAEKIVENLTSVTKKVPPGAIIPVPSVRKAMGVVSDNIEAAKAGKSAVGTQPDNSSGEGVGKDLCISDLDSDLRDILENGSGNCTFEITDSKPSEEIPMET